MEYTIVKSEGRLFVDNFADFIWLVNKHISEGWTPLGGVALDTRAAGIGGYYQAMTREKPEK